jgi:hypothetical protein
MRAVMRALIDIDGGFLERWNAWVGGETGSSGTPMSVVSR